MIGPIIGDRVSEDIQLKDNSRHVSGGEGERTSCGRRTITVAVAVILCVRAENSEKVLRIRVIAVREDEG